jgi:CheY-like chemotaxis protein
MNPKSQILIIDDDEDDSLLLIEAIQEVMPETSFVTLKNGIDALKYLMESKDQSPAYIFLDLNMPIMDGKAFLKELLKYPELKKGKIVIYSTSNNDMDKIETQVLGAHHYMIKPTSFSDLRNLIRSLFKEVAST